MKPNYSARTQNRFSSELLRGHRVVSDIRQDALEYLTVRPRSMPPKYFYDATGSDLFEQICQTAEYYPTRTEAGLLRSHAGEILAVAEPGHIIEFGSGSSVKTRLLFDAWSADDTMPPFIYHPVDVSEDMLLASGQQLAADYPWLEVCAHVGDYHGGLGNLEIPGDHRRLALFLGGTIGNFSEDEAHQFLSELHDWLRPGDMLLLGADRVKSVDQLERAYNDSAEVTAAFNRNLLVVLNRELGADFDPNDFRHEAIYNEGRDQIEMYLVAERDCEVQLTRLGQHLHFTAGERLLTEISRKFTQASLESLLEVAGFHLQRHFESRGPLYSLVLAKA